jgi:hypothetical protein
MGDEPRAEPSLVVFGWTVTASVKIFLIETDDVYANGPMPTESVAWLFHFCVGGRVLGDQRIGV